MNRMFASLALLVLAASARAQTAVAINPGMTQTQVVARLGDPISSRSYGGHTYLLFKNGCEKKCGMNDLVVLDSGKVIDAVFRDASRIYTGKSSSPKMISRQEAKREGDQMHSGQMAVPPAKKSTP